MRGIRIGWIGAVVGLWMAWAPLGAAAAVVAPGYTVTEIALPDTAGGDVMVVGGAVFVGVGPGFVGGAQSIVRIDSGGTTEIASGFNGLSGFAYDAVNDRLIVGDNALEAFGAVTGDTVYAIPNPLGSFPTPLPAASQTLLPNGTLPGVADLALDVSDPAGNTLFVTDSVTNELFVVDLVGSTVTSLQSTAGFAAGVAADATTIFFGDVSFDAMFNANGSIFEVVMPGSGAPTTVVTGLPGQYDLELETAGTLLSTSGPDLVRVDPDTSSVTTVASGFGFATGLFEQGGSIWVLDGGFPPVSVVYQLVPIPEPGTALLVGGGLALLGAARRPRTSRRRTEPTCKAEGRAASRRRAKFCGTAAAALPLVLGFAALADPAAAGRVRPPIEFVSPKAGAEVTWMPLALQLSLSGQAQVGTLEVTLNGHDVSELFETSAPSPGARITAHAEHVWDGAVVAGENELEVSVQIGSNPAPTVRSISFDAVGDPYADDVDLASLVVGTYGGYPGLGALPEIVTGPPRGAGLSQGGVDVFSIGFGGQIAVEFLDNVIKNGPGTDFAVFENAFMVENAATLTFERPFCDPGAVEVSQDGNAWHAFSCSLVLDLPNGIAYPGCAGVYPVFANATDPSTPHASIPTSGGIDELIGASSAFPPEPGGAGGDRFDLAAVGLDWARYVRVVDPDFPTGDPYGSTNAGFDLDAVAAIHSVPATDANENGIPDAVE